MKRTKQSDSLANRIGPGLITGAADDDPSGIATYSQAGAQFGFSLLWTMILTYPLMTAVQLVSAHIGRTTGHGLAHNMRKVMPDVFVYGMVAFLFVANTINIGADLAAMGGAGELVTGISHHVFTAAFAILSILLQCFASYRRYANLLKWLTFSLFAYVAVLLVVHIDWTQALKGMVIPSIGGVKGIGLIVAIFGTTISPYLFFWQSSQEVEEVIADKDAKPLRHAPQQAKKEIRRIRFDSFLGMLVSNLVAIAIILSTAATLHAQGKTNIESASDAAKALQPVAGDYAFWLFSAGIIGTGLLAIPVLAGATAYGISGLRDWKAKLDHKPWQAPQFYTVIAVSTILGAAIDWSPINPMKALVWSAIINGVAAVPIMVGMMVIASNRKVMGDLVIGRPLRFFGWLATIVMAAAAVGLLF